VIENQNKVKNTEIKEFFLHKFPCKRRFRNEIYSLLKGADGRGNADIINGNTVDYAYLYFAGQTYSNCQKVGACTEYLIPTENIIA